MVTSSRNRTTHRQRRWIPPTNAGIDFQCTSIAASTPADRTSSVFWTQWKTCTVWTIPLKLYLQACLCFSSAVWNFTASKSSRAPKHAQYTNVVSPSSGPFPLQYACRQWEQTQSLTKGRSKLRLQSCRLKFADLIPWLFRSAWEDKLKVHACVFAKVAFYKMWLKTVWCKNIFLVKWANSLKFWCERKSVNGGQKCLFSSGEVSHHSDLVGGMRSTGDHIFYLKK